MLTFKSFIVFVSMIVVVTRKWSENASVVHEFCSACIYFSANIEILQIGKRVTYYTIPRCWPSYATEQRLFKFKPISGCIQRLLHTDHGRTQFEDSRSDWVNLTYQLIDTMPVSSCYSFSGINQTRLHSVQSAPITPLSTSHRHAPQEVSPTTNNIPSKRLSFSCRSVRQYHRSPEFFHDFSLLPIAEHSDRTYPLRK